MQGCGEVGAETDDSGCNVRRPIVKNVEEEMSAVQLRSKFPVTLACGLSWRLAVSAAIRREETLIALREVAR